MATIEKRSIGNGVTYRARVRTRGVSRTATFRRKKDARDWITDTEAAIQRGDRIPTTREIRRTVGDLIDHYLDEYLPSKRRNRDKRNVERHLKWWREQIGDQRLSAVTGALLTEHRRKLEADVGPGTVNRYLTSLSHAFTVGVRQLEWLERNPVHAVERLEEPGGRDRFLSPEEIVELLKAAKKSTNRDLYAIVVLALSTGMRRGEIRWLTWDDVDLKAGQIRLRKEATKTGKARVVPLVGRAHELLTERKKVRRIDNRFVFPGRKRDVPQDFRKHWEAAVKAAKIADYRFHDNRHSAASYLLMTGASELEVAAILGHETLAMVKRYAHLSDAHRRKVLERMNREVFGHGA